jgi:hypothetical protein
MKSRLISSLLFGCSAMLMISMPSPPLNAREINQSLPPRQWLENVSWFAWGALLCEHSERFNAVYEYYVFNNNYATPNNEQQLWINDNIIMPIESEIRQKYPNLFIQSSNTDRWGCDDCSDKRRFCAEFELFLDKLLIENGYSF